MNKKSPLRSKIVARVTVWFSIKISRSAVGHSVVSIGIWRIIAISHGTLKHYFILKDFLISQHWGALKTIIKRILCN